MSEKEEVYHLPGMVVVQFLFFEVSKNIPEFGYSIIVFQPQDLVQTDKSGITLDTGLLKSTLYSVYTSF